MDDCSANLYFKDNYLAHIHQISYETPWFCGRHQFADKQLLAKLVRISQFKDSHFWTDDSLSDDEQDQKLNALQLMLGITDDDLNRYYYDNYENWTIVLSNNQKFTGFPRIDETHIEWR